MGIGAQDQASEIGQVREATEALGRTLQGALLAVYLHGSTVSGGLRPRSDIDLLVVVDRPLTLTQRRDLLSALLRLSGRHPSSPGGPRCIEVMVFVGPEIAAPDFPVRAEFTYGEWLREAFEAGEVPMPTRDPENTLVLAQAWAEARPLLGPEAAALLPDIAWEQVRAAMRDLLPRLLGGLEGDERNVLLTLARMWRTAASGAFVTKDAAAAWAAPRVPDDVAATLMLACEGYLGRADDDWTERWEAARRAVDVLSRRVADLLR